MESINNLKEESTAPLEQNELNYTPRELPLVDENDPILHREIPEYEFDGSLDPIKLAHDLSANLLAKGGIGLAANQIGLDVRAFAIKSSPMIVMFNPTIVNSSEEKTIEKEGCLSFPGLFMKVKRAKEVRVRYTRPNGETTTETYSGLTARIIQHELDHLNGITFRKRVSLYEKNKGDRNRKKHLDNLRKGMI